jgi:hypothetical protein
VPKPLVIFSQRCKCGDGELRHSNLPMVLEKTAHGLDQPCPPFLTSSRWPQQE